MTTVPWHALPIRTVRETTGATTWQLAKARMTGGGWPVFSHGTFRGNRSYYLAGPVETPDLPFWEACRAFLATHGIVEASASKAEVWEAVSFHEELGLWPHAQWPRKPILDQVKPLFWADDA